MTTAARDDALPEAAARQRLTAVEERLAAACRRADRDPRSVTLVGAGKRQPIARLATACEAGLAVLGENRVDEAERHREELERLDPSPATAVAWHLIGPLQSNKVRRAAQLFDLVHSIDRPKIAHLLDRHLGELGRSIPAFLEINLGREPTKHGFAPDGLAEAVRPLADLEHLRIQGLMAIPPQSDEPDRARTWFRQLRSLRDELAGRPEWEAFAGSLSMGMSDDFEIAVEEGATHVRVGTALFGRRES